MLASLQPDGYIPRKTAKQLKNETKVERITPKNRLAVEAMVWMSLNRAEAAKYAGISEHSLYIALRKPVVRQLYLSELEVLRTSGKAHRLRRLEEIGDQNDNLNAAVNAIKLLDYQEESRANAADRGATAGFVIQVIAAPGTTIAGRIESEVAQVAEQSQPLTG